MKCVLTNLENFFNNKRSSLIALLILFSLVAACQSKPKPHVDRSVDYENERSIPPLKVPAKVPEKLAD